ncbi:MAG TPA: site-specific DNA-methyltransferase, partial [Candidatus Kapabacteria bacterium]|nr:site-specific DNA-methyltransferase [Candidatus Kapabacteria bacterium]
MLFDTSNINSNAQLLTIKEASVFASSFTGKKVTTSNITYLIQYGRIRKYGSNGQTLVSKEELIEYYNSHKGK